MKPRHKRVAIIVGGLITLGVAAYLVLNAFQSNLVFFFTPTQVASGEAPKNRTFRIGGLVKPGSIKRDNLNVTFVVTDTAKDMNVSYTGILPDLFREGKGVVAQASSQTTASSPPPKCWPSTTKTTCRPKPSRPWIRPS